MATPTASVEQNVTIVTLEGAFPPREPDWLGLVVMLLMLAFAGGFARRRSLLVETEAPPRLLRIFYTAAMFAGSLTLWLVVEYFAGPGASDELLPMVAVGAVILTIVGMVIFGIADFWLGLLRPRRTRRWLAFAVLSFVLLVTASVALILWTQDSIVDLFLPEVLQVIVLGAAAGIIWWAYLPMLRLDVAERFD